MDRSQTKYELYGKTSIGESMTLGLQHVVAMFVPSLVPMLLVSKAANLNIDMTTSLIQSAMIGAGLATLLQIFPLRLGRKVMIGSDLPVVLGLTYVFMPSCIAIAAQYGMATVFGAQLVAAIFPFVFGVFFLKLRSIFPPIVTGTVVMSLGFSVFTVAVNNMAGGVSSPDFGSITNWFIAGITVVIVLILQQFGRGLLKDAAILLGMFVGYIAAVTQGKVDFTPIAEASWFALPRPLAFGVEFRPEVIGIFAILYIIVSIQLVGDMTVSSTGGLGRQPKDAELAGGIMGNAVSSFVIGVLNSFPTATYSQNSGLVALNKVISKRVFFTASMILVIAGICPKIGALMSTIPNAVIGGGTLVVFAMIAMSGVRLVTHEELDGRSILIVGVSLAMGLGVSASPDSMGGFPPMIQMVFGRSAVVLATVLAVIFNLVFPKQKEIKEQRNR